MLDVIFDLGASESTAEGSGAETLRQTAAEFQMLHWSRLAFNAVSAASIFVGFVAVYRQRVLAEAAEAATRETSADRQQRTPDQTRALAGPVAAR